MNVVALNHAVSEATVQPLGKLVEMIEDAANTLSGAHSAAEILDARDKAALAYDAAKRAARFAQARDAHNTVVAAAHRAQARALEIEAGAKRRLADEYDAAQERGEIAKRADGPAIRDHVPEQNKIKSDTVSVLPATTADIGLSRKDIHEARIIRDAEQSEPGIVRRALDAVIAAGEEPTKAKLRRVVKGKSRRTRKPRHGNVASTETQHDRDLRMLLGVWEAACQSARDEFLNIVVN